MHRVLIVLFWLTATLLLPSYATSKTVARDAGDGAGPPDPRQWYFHIRYAHLLVECTVESIHKRAVTLGQLHADDSARRDDSRQVGIRIGQLSDVTVLRGTQTPSEIYLPNGLDNDILGQRVIFCCFWVRGLRMYGAPFLEMVYLKRGDEWVELGRPLNAPDITISSADLAALIRETKPAALARKADVIVVGAVTSYSDSSIAYGDAPLHVKRIKLHAEQVLKGTLEKNDVEFLVSGGFPTPGWWTKTPNQFDNGQRWFVFLAQHEDGFFYPLGGHNGLLLVHGQELIYDGAAYPYSRLSLTRTVSAALNSR